MIRARTDIVPGFGDAGLAIHRVGEGRPVVLLHGLFSDANLNWIKFGHAERIAALGYEVSMPDLRAHGQSAAPHDAASYPPDVLIRDLVAVLDHLDCGSGFDLGGFSLGARTVLHAVAKGALQPERLIVGGMGVEGLSQWRKRAAHFTRVIDEFEAIPKGEPAWYAVQFLKSQKVDRVAARHLLGTFTDLSPELLAKATMPTLVVCGADDHDNGLASDLAESLPDADYVEVPGTHMSSVTRPEFGQAIAEWLGPADAIPA